MTMFDAGLVQIVQKDPRYACEAYEFIFDALTHTQEMLGLPELREASPEGSQAPHHVSGSDLMHGVRELALREFGLMARIVLHMWGVDRTADFGEIVFNLIDAGLMTRTNEDRREDFHNIFDLDEALRQNFQITLDEVPGS